MTDDNIKEHDKADQIESGQEDKVTNVNSEIGSGNIEKNTINTEIEEIKSDMINISYSSIYKFGFIIIAMIVAIMLFTSFSPSQATGLSAATGNSVNVPSNNAPASGDVQTASMKVVNGEYVITPNAFKVGQKVRITADMSQMPGCSKSIVISAFGVRKTLSSSSNIIEFTPTKAGTFFITCSMNMYQGQFTVTESDGTKAAYAEAKPSGGHTCGGAGGGGCGGCGG